LNAVVEFEYDGDPSRTIDIDLLYGGDKRVNNERLQLPHPRLHLREFVLRPLADIRPDLILRGKDKTVKELLAKVSKSGDVVRCEDRW
jgi:2-amino-4-hydroxy-6-hydroxymethyldihydropteridine diphosphokinase